jgi:holdfast attachment protein HfaA
VRVYLIAGLIGLLLTSAAHADPFASSSSAFSRGFGMDGDSFNQPINPSTRDANGNRLIVNGQIMSDTTLSGGISDGFASGVASASASASSASSAQAIGNQLNVVTQGNWNTVIINSTQNNSGDISAVSQGGKH